MISCVFLKDLNTMRRTQWRETKCEMRDRKKPCSIPGNRQGFRGCGGDDSGGEKERGRQRKKGDKVDRF